MRIFNCKSFLLLLGVVSSILFYTTGCGGFARTAMTESMRSSIPVGSNLVVVESSLPADKLYSMAKDTILAAGCESRDASDRIRDFESKECSPGASRAEFQVHVTVDETSTGSRLEAQGMGYNLRQEESKYGANRWTPVAMADPSDKFAGNAFEEVVLLLDGLPGEMEFQER